MARRSTDAVREGILLAFTLGSVAGMTGPELLERYCSDRDEAAFEALVARYGPMVLGVCLRRLSRPQDVSDAFQATFLVLVRRAGSLLDAGRLGPWPYGVACRVSARARRDSARRRRRDVAGARKEVVFATPDLERAEVVSVLD